MNFPILLFVVALMTIHATGFSYALVYAGPGASSAFVDYTISTLRKHLSRKYIIKKVYADELAERAWLSSTSLIVLPGGRDIPYVEDLLGLANENIIEFVNTGGKFIGFCAGSYYASGRCEFEVGNPKLEVVGERPLKFFPGTCRGATFKGFDYASEAGARASYVTLSHSDDMLPIYYNGGGAFVDAEKYPGVEVLATYNGLNNTTPNIAAILTSVGNGTALLSAVHPEYIPFGLYPGLDAPLILNRHKIYSTVKHWLERLDLELRENSLMAELDSTITSHSAPEVLLIV